jgi:hypothetical protein
MGPADQLPYDTNGQQFGVARESLRRVRPLHEGRLGTIRVVNRVGAGVHHEVVLVLDRELQRRRDSGRGTFERLLRFAGIFVGHRTCGEHRPQYAGNRQRRGHEAPTP